VISTPPPGNAVDREQRRFVRMIVTSWWQIVTHSRMRGPRHAPKLRKSAPELKYLSSALAMTITRVSGAAMSDSRARGSSRSMSQSTALTGGRW
jgi:hypothetical protein